MPSDEGQCRLCERCACTLINELKELIIDDIEFPDKLSILKEIVNNLREDRSDSDEC